MDNFGTGFLDTRVAMRELQDLAADYVRVYKLEKFHMSASARWLFI